MRTPFIALISKALVGSALAGGLLSGIGTSAHAQTGFHQRATSTVAIRTLAHHVNSTLLRGPSTLRRGNLLGGGTGRIMPMRGPSTLRHASLLGGGTGRIMPMRGPSTLRHANLLGGGTGQIMPLGRYNP